MPYASKEDRAQWFQDWKLTPKGIAWCERRKKYIREKRKNERKSKTVKVVKAELGNRIEVS